MDCASALVYIGKRQQKNKKSKQKKEFKAPKKQFMEGVKEEEDDEKFEEEKKQEQQIQKKQSLNQSYSSSSSDSISDDDIDTNVFAIDFNFLKKTNQIAMGDPTFCKKCQAVLNKHSKILSAKEYLQIKKEEIELLKSQLKSKEQQEQDDFVMINQQGLEIQEHEKLWKCEFCGEENKIRIEEEEIPTQEDVIYIVESANQQEKKDDSDFSIVFCLDNSGSMSVTTEVQGQKMNLKHGLTQEEYEMLKQFIDEGDENQIMPGQKKNSTFVSRKQCVLAAIEQQLQDMTKEHPNRKVGVVTFSDDVVILGDGHSLEPHIITGDKLYNENQIKEDTISKAENALKNTIKNSIDQLGKKFNSLEEKGRTALGPALLSSIQLAGKGKPGSMVVICTDGLANVGLGSLDLDDSQEEEKVKSKQFYENLAQTAKELGIVISVITIKGEGCKIEVLGNLAEQTNGTVTRVDPGDIGKDFASILQDEVLGTKVDLNVQLHKSLQFRNENKKFLLENGTKYQRHVGNATVNTRVTFEFQSKPDEILQMEKIDLDNLKEIPFQAKVYYYTLKGDKYLRVLSQQFKTTQDKFQAEQKVHKVDVIHKRIAYKSSSFMQQGKVKKAQKFNSKFNHYVQENDNINSNQSNLISNQEFKSQNHVWKKCANKQVSRKKCKESFPSSVSSQGGGGQQGKKGFFSKVKGMFSSSKQDSNEIQQQQQQQLSMQDHKLSSKIQEQKEEEDVMFSASDGGYSSDEDKDEAMMINFKQGKMKK